MESKNFNISFLVVQLQQGNDLAFTELHDLYSKPLFKNILRLVKEREIAEELLQDLFMKIWEIRETIDPQKSFKSFLYKVAENLVYGHFRKVASSQRLMGRIIASSVDSVTGIDEDIINREDHQLLKKAIANLPAQRQRIYILCKLEGKSYEEVGQELGVSQSTIHDHIVKGNKAVKLYFHLNQDVAIALIISQIIKHL